jgi:hypothetical protein
MDQRRPNPQTNKQGLPPQWTTWIWFLLMTLAMVWFWQEGSHQVGVRTISYSQFKEYLHNGEVTDCTVQQTEIDGNIQPKTTPISKQAEASPTPPAKTKPEAAAKSKATKPGTPSEAKALPEAAPEANKSAEVSTKPTTPTSPSEKENQPAAEKAFAFRTVRVDDPDLVNDLEKAGVKWSYCGYTYPGAWAESESR